MDNPMLALGRAIAHQQLLTYCLAHLFAGDEDFKQKLEDMLADCIDNMSGTARAMKVELGASDERVAELSSACNEQVEIVVKSAINLLSNAQQVGPRDHSPE